MALYSTFLTEINNIYHLSFDQSSFIVLKHSNLGVLNYDFITTSLSPLHESTQPPPPPFRCPHAILTLSHQKHSGAHSNFKKNNLCRSTCTRLHSLTLGSLSGGTGTALPSDGCRFTRFHSWTSGCPLEVHHIVLKNASLHFTTSVSIFMSTSNQKKFNS